MPETTAYKLNGIIVAAAALTMARIAAAHPTCIYGNKASYVGRVMTFCPQHEVACCDEAEEMASKELFYNASATELTGACMVYYKQVACGPCHSHSGHLFERLVGTLGHADGMTMKRDFCERLVEVCGGQIEFPSYDGESYCDKHVGGGNERQWSYPIDPEELDAKVNNPGMVDAFPDLPESELPAKLISMRMTPSGGEWWLAGQEGEIKKVAAKGAKSALMVIDIGSGVGLSSTYEEGLLDFAFNPAFERNHYFYISYNIEDGDTSRNRLARFTYFEDNPADTKLSVDVILTSDPKVVQVHSGGWVGFKPSAYRNPSAKFHDIFWTMGDSRAEGLLDIVIGDLDHLVSAIARVSVPSGTEAGDTGYAVPPGNYQGGRRREICALGFHNPFRCSFDSRTDDLYCGDVGSEKIEEINLITCGKDYGWTRFQGTLCQDHVEHQPGGCVGVRPEDFAFPEFQYCHTDYFSTDDDDLHTGGVDTCGSRQVTGSAVIGGYVYHGQKYKDILDGALVFADMQRRNIHYLKKDGEEWVPGNIISDRTAPVISFSEDHHGELYVIAGDRRPYELPCGDLCREGWAGRNKNEGSNAASTRGTPIGGFFSVSAGAVQVLMASDQRGNASRTSSHENCRIQQGDGHVNHIISSRGTECNR